VFPPRIYSFDSGKYDFRRLLRDAFGGRLETLGSGKSIEVLRRGTDQTTEFHKKFYDCFNGLLRQTYLSFIREAVAPLFDEPICYQAVPTFRVHLPGNIAVGEFHTDGDYNHGVGEVNFWLPCTRAFATNSIWVESSLGSGDFQAIDVEYGEILVFDAVRWHHGNRQNMTGQTRVSFDFRCITMSNYRPTGARTVSSGRALEIGDYFAEMPLVAPP
jgi:hypothetical protein